MERDAYGHPFFCSDALQFFQVGSHVRLSYLKMTLAIAAMHALACGKRLFDHPIITQGDQRE